MTSPGVLVLILEVIQRTDATRVAYFEYERPSVGVFEAPLERIEVYEVLFTPNDTSGFLAFFSHRF